MNDDQNPNRPAGSTPNAPSAASSPEAVDYSKPVAYDNQGRPLYAHPPANPSPAAPAPAPEPQVSHQYVHIARPIDPSHPDIPEDILRRHESSRRNYPRLNLSRGEFIISAVKRHPIGIIQIWLIAFVLVGTLAVMASFFVADNQGSDVLGLAVAGIGALSILIAVGALVATYVYNNNRFFLTNESVIQEIQDTLFSRHEQTVSLANIEDASYRQNGLIQHLLNYGTIRLSTEGDETTYRFSYVANPKQHIAKLNNAVEAFKNGRPVDVPDEEPRYY